MKKVFYLPVLLFITNIIFAQTPGGVAGSVLWLKANTGASPAAWTDYSTSANSFSQPVTGNQPILTPNTFNFNAALAFDGATSFMTQPSPVGFPENLADRTVFVVAKGGASGEYQWVFTYGTYGPPYNHTFQVGSHYAGLCNAFYGSEVTYPNYWTDAANPTGAMNAFTISGGNGFQYEKGNFLQFQDLSGLGLAATSVNGVIGGIFNPSLNQTWSGSIGEIILFNSALSDANRQKVESYLAMKYGFTLGSNSNPISYTASDGSTVYWTASATYQNDVFGIGSDASGTALTQLQSNSMNTGNGDGTGQSGKGNLTLSTPFALADKQFLMIGNDAGALTEHLIATGEAPVVAEGSQRLIRNWKVQNTNSVVSGDLSFDVTGLTLTGGTTASNYQLMIDEDGDGNYFTGTQRFVKAASFTGNKINFAGVALFNNSVFTIITQASALLPANWQGFTATLQNNSAILTWKTSNEVNVDHYTVEYSADGIGFTTGPLVTAKNGTGVNTYSITQNNLPAGTRYYRIKRVDKDGNFTISDIRSVRVGGFTSVLIKLNPINEGKLELNIDATQNQEAVIRVVNMSGKVIVQQNKGLSAGSNSVTANMIHAAAGTYFLQVQLATEIINKKFIKL